jgi:hypothetical protein
MKENHKGSFAAATLLNKRKGKRNGLAMVKQERRSSQRNF